MTSAIDGCCTTVPNTEWRLLYISYDGMLEPLGQSQVLAYLRGLAPRCAAVTLISYEKPHDLADTRRVQQLERDLAANGITWRPLRYHKRPSALATAYDVASGIVRALPLVWRGRVNVIHARSYVPALEAWCLKRLSHVAWIFDMRGFWADERVEGGLWSERSVLYRLVKRLERWFLADADAIVTLTERAAATVRAWTGRPADHITVIPTCVDLARFQWAGNSSANGAGPRFVYAGSVGTWYCLDHVIQFFARARERFPNAELVILTRDVEEARASLTRVAVPPGAVTIKSVEPHEIPAHLAGAYTGLAFYKPGFARQATCPTKIGEYLALGVPVVTNAAVGDVVSLVGDNNVGAVIDGFDAAAYDAALDALERLWRDAVLRARCRTLAESTFSLQLGVARYGSIYERVTLR